jgi:hypothetical protein
MLAFKLCPSYLALKCSFRVQEAGPDCSAAGAFLFLFCTPGADFMNQRRPEFTGKPSTGFILNDIKSKNLSC